MDIIKSAGIAFIASLFCIYLLRPIGIRVGFVDHPNERKWHKEAVPLIGGIAMFFGFCFALLDLNFSLQNFRGLLAGSGLLILMGSIDDFNELHAVLRLFGQLIAVILLIIWDHVIIQQIGNLFFLGPILLEAWAVPLTILLTLANINAMNMIDGQDGLAGGVAFGQAVLLLALAVHLHAALEIRFLIIIIMLLLVFLSFNMRLPWRKHASIFMGDSGSTFIAFLMVCFAIRLSQKSLDIKPITLLWIMSFPLFDLITVMATRIRQGQSIFLAGRDHVHYILHLFGLSTIASTWLLCGYSFILGLIGLAFNYLAISESIQFIIWLFTFAIYIYTVEFLRKPADRIETVIPDVGDAPRCSE